VLPLVSYIAYVSVTDDDDRRQRPLLVCPRTLCVGGPVIAKHFSIRKNRFSFSLFTTEKVIFMPLLKKLVGASYIVFGACICTGTGACIGWYFSADK